METEGLQSTNWFQIEVTVPPVNIHCPSGNKFPGRELPSALMLAHKQKPQKAIGGRTMEMREEEKAAWQTAAWQTAAVGLRSSRISLYFTPKTSSVDCESVKTVKVQHLGELLYHLSLSGSHKYSIPLLEKEKVFKPIQTWSSKNGSLITFSEEIYYKTLAGLCHSIETTGKQNE